MSPNEATPGYKDSAQPISARVDDLLARMTLDEKLAQLGCVWSMQLVDGEAFSLERARERMPNGTGHVKLGIRSFIRLKQRSSVLFPEPDGPMIAVILWRATSRSTSEMTWLEP